MVIILTRLDFLRIEFPAGHDAPTNIGADTISRRFSSPAGYGRRRLFSLRRLTFRDAIPSLRPVQFTSRGSTTRRTSPIPGVK
jgi:hypothetical protein